MQEIKKIPKCEDQFDYKYETQDDTERLNDLAKVDLRFKAFATKNQGML
jgi:hypothetical protein